jgi:polyisoprenoid-binding protein YceI
MKTILVTTLLILSAVAHAAPKAAAQAVAAIQKFKPSADSTATFEAVGRPSLLKIDGKGAKLGGELQIADSKATGKFDLDLTGFDTGIDTRNEHMKEKYLETQKFPKAFLTLEKVDLPAGFKPGDSADVPFKGQLTVKDVAKPVQGKVKINGGTMTSSADFSFKLSDYPVGVPKYMGITVADDVNVHVAIPAFTKE